MALLSAVPAVALLGLLLRWWLLAPVASRENLAEGRYVVERVIDGDTLQLVGGARLRLMGVNTPETLERWGPEATEFTRRWVAESDFVVRLQFDRERLDRFDRYLAYVWRGDSLLNEELLRAGLARYEGQFSYSVTMKRRFQRAQQQAQAEHLGLWQSNFAPSDP